MKSPKGWARALLLLSAAGAVARLAAADTPWAPPPTLEARAASAGLLFLLGAVTGWFMAADRGPVSWRSALGGGALLFAAATLSASVILHALILVWIPALFCLAGTALGAAAAPNRRPGAVQLTSIDRDPPTPSPEEARR